MLVLSGCDSSSEENVSTPETPVAEAKGLETTKVTLQFNLPALNDVLDPEQFSASDPVTYHSSVGYRVCDTNGNEKNLTTYFIYVSENRWQVLFNLDGSPLNIINSQGNNVLQNSAELTFNNDGSFIRQFPYIIESEEINEHGVAYSVEFDFYSHPSTSFDEPFNAQVIDTNGC